MLIHAALLTAVQVQPLAVLTATLPVPAAGPKDWLSRDREYPQVEVIDFETSLEKPLSLNSAFDKECSWRVSLR